MPDRKTTLKPAAKVLIVDDSHLNRCFVENAFAPPNYIVISADNARTGIELAHSEKPELILMDIMMPGMNGFDATIELKSSPETKDIPIIFITALDAVRDRLRAFEVGAVDFVTKPFNHKELIARVNTNILLRRSTEERQNMLKLALEGKRSESIARIAAGVSHNFNNMLSVTSGNLMLVQSMIKDKLDQTSQSAFDDINTSVKRMQDMVKQFLLLANRNNEVCGGTPVINEVKLKELVTDITVQINHSNHFAEYHCDIDKVEEETIIYMDHSHARQIFSLLLGEVHETTQGLASSVVEAKSDPLTKKYSCTISVEDMPIPKEVQDSLFEPFSLPIANVGTGLSYSVAKQLIELNKSTINAEFPSDTSIIFTISN